MSCRPPTPPRSSSTSPAWPCSSCSGADCVPARRAPTSGSCSPSPGSRARTRPTRSSRTPTTRWSRADLAAPLVAGVAAGARRSGRVRRADEVRAICARPAARGRPSRRGGDARSVPVTAASRRACAPSRSSRRLAAVTLRDGPDADRPGRRTFFDRTIANQVDRDSPFSVWGQTPSLDWLQVVVQAAVVALALLVASSRAAAACPGRGACSRGDDRRRSSPPTMVLPRHRVVSARRAGRDRAAGLAQVRQPTR